MTNQERNREALIDHIYELQRIIRRRNEQLAQQADNAMEAQRAIDEQVARNNSLPEDLAVAVVRAEKAEQERDDLRESYTLALKYLDEAQATIASLRAENPRPLTADDGMLSRAVLEARKHKGTALALHSEVQAIVNAAITEPKPQPEGAEEIQKVLDRYWRGDIDGEDLAGRIAEEMNR